MYTYEEQCMMDLSDNYTLLYSFMGRELIDTFGLEGERALREGTRRYGRDRGIHSRERHLKAGYKVNMESLFSIGGDLPPDPRFRRELQELNPQERISHTLICPMADVWKENNEQRIGRIYCEEFHPACYNHYAFDCGHTNLAKTLTQENDEYCAFNVILRAEDLPDDLKPLCFMEYDPGYVKPENTAPQPDGKKGFESLSIKIYYYVLECACEAFGEEGALAIGRALHKAATDGAKRVKETARKYGKEIDATLVFDSYPISLQPEKISLWEEYQDHDAVRIFKENFVPEMLSQLSLSLS